MDTCTSKDVVDKNIEVPIEKIQKEDSQEASKLESPLLVALTAHFATYSGLLEPRLEIANISLDGPRREDL